MNAEQRSQVLDNAKYLRQVRPIDPGEIHEYVDGQPHPAAVRQVLREAAPELALVEREDGRFEPVAPGPVHTSGATVEEVPQHVTRRLETLLVEHFGAGWPDGESGATLRTVIRDFKRRYLQGAPVTYDSVTALGYAIYHLPSYFATIQYVLGELVDDGRLPMHLRVLDVGAGVGGPALGIDSLYPADGLIEYHAVEPSDGVSVLEAMLEETGRNFHSTVHQEPIETFSADEQTEFDILLFANVLSELEDPEAVLLNLLECLATDGTIVAIAPADRQTALQLRQIERTVESQGDVTVYAPTVRLWPHETPESSCWSFDRKPDLAVPGFQQRLDEGARIAGEHEGVSQDLEASEVAVSSRPGESLAEEESRKPGDGEFVNVDVQYAYSLLTTDGEQAIDYRPDPGRVAKLAETEKHVTDRIDCVAIKLSHNLSEGNPLFLLGDGSEKVDHFAVLTQPSALNRDLETSEYGGLLHFENTLVLWNDDEGAYNLVVDGETVVDRIPV